MYIQNNSLLLADVFENFWKICLVIYELNHACFLAVPGLAWQAALRNTKVRLDLLTDIDRILVVEKGIKRGICHTIHLYAKANDHDKNKESSHIKYWDVNHLYG